MGKSKISLRRPAGPGEISLNEALVPVYMTASLSPLYIFSLDTTLLLEPVSLCVLKAGVLLADQQGKYAMDLKVEPSADIRSSGGSLHLKIVQGVNLQHWPALESI